MREYTSEDVLAAKRWELIVALASNPKMVIEFVGNDNRLYPETKLTRQNILEQADAIIAEMEKEK